MAARFSKGVSEMSTNCGFALAASPRFQPQTTTTLCVDIFVGCILVSGRLRVVFLWQPWCVRINNEKRAHDTEIQLRRAPGFQQFAPLHQKAAFLSLYWNKDACFSFFLRNLSVIMNFAAIVLRHSNERSSRGNYCIVQQLLNCMLPLFSASISLWSITFVSDTLAHVM